MAEVKRYREGGLMYESEHGDYVRRAVCVRLERERDELRRAFERAEADVQVLSRDVERLRAENDRMTRIVAAARHLIYADEKGRITDFGQALRSLAEACGRKG